MRILSLLLVIKLAAGQLTLNNDVELVPAMPNMAQITSLDVQCEKSGMTVNVGFSQPFNGVIFSKGHFSNPACRYVRGNSGQDSYTFVIPMMDCGTRTFDGDDGSTGFENMIMIQHEEIVQEIWDTARKITCNWTTRMEKLITFRPFAVDMLPAKNIRYSADNVMCWMDIQLGKGPFSNTVDGIVKIGDELTIVIYSRDGGSEFDMMVKNCYAYDSDDLEDERTTRLQLSDERGCLLKPKLMSYFYRTKDTGTTGADIIAYASLYAFKFPDKMDVYLSCEVELCKGGCTRTCNDPGFPSNLIASHVSTSTTTTTLRPPNINPCIIQPGSPQCCTRSPSHSSCISSTTSQPGPCDINPGLPQCCARNPSAPECLTTTSTSPRTTTARTSTTTVSLDPCLRNPRSSECCALNPNTPLCRPTTRQTTQPPSTTRFNPCLRNPRSRQCCALNPSAPQCISMTEPTTSTTVRSTFRPPTSPRIDPCILNPRSPQCCIRNPSSIQCTTTTTPRPEPCDLNPLLPQCCARNPDLPQCRRTTQTTTPQTTTTPRRISELIISTSPPITTSRRTTRLTTTERITTTPFPRTTRTSTTPLPDPCDLNPTSSECCAKNPFSPQCSTTRSTTLTTTSIPGPCEINPRSNQCCALNPNSPQCMTTTRRTTTSTTTTTRPRTTRRITTTQLKSTTTPIPDPCDINPGSVQCCSRNPSSPGCVISTTQRITTTKSDPCVSNPGSPRCCAINPNHPRCATKAPCSGPGDPRPECQITTQVPRTTPNLEFHAFHKWQTGAPIALRRRRPPYGTRLSADVLAELTNTPRRRRRDVALPPPPPPPPPPQRNTVSMVSGFRVVGANDLAFRAVSLVPHAAAIVDSVCVPRATFAVGLLMLSLLLITAVLIATFSCLRLRSLSPSKSVEAKNPYYKQ